MTVYKIKYTTGIYISKLKMIYLILLVISFSFTTQAQTESKDSETETTQDSDTATPEDTDIESPEDSDTVTPADSDKSNIDSNDKVDTSADGLSEPENVEVPRGVEEDSSTSMMMSMSLEELLATPVTVWSASKTEESIETAPSVIEVVTADDMRLWGFQTVGDVLENLTGFYVVDNHIIPNVSVRGISGGLGSESGNIKLMINGRTVAFRTTAGNWLGAELIPYSAIDRIEIIRGPASALYGADAFLATINVILKKPEDLQGAIIHGALMAQTDKSNNIESVFDLDNQYDVVGGAQIGKFGFLFSVGGEHNNRTGLNLPSSSPAPLIPEYNSANTQAADLIHDSNVFYGELSYLGDKGSLRISGLTSTILRDGEFSHWTQLSKGADHTGRSVGTVINLNQTTLGIDGDLQASKNVNLTMSLSYFQGNPLNDDRIEVASDLFYIKRDFKYQGINGVAEMHLTPLKSLNIVIGSEVLYDHETLQKNNRIDKTTGENLGIISSSSAKNVDLVNPGVYLHANYDAVPDFLKLTGGIRYDYHNVYGSKITGRAGTIFLWNRYFSTKLLYGSAFKAPSPLMLYSTPLQPGDIIGNEKLKPQYVHTVELSPTLHLLKYLTLNTTVAYNQIIDKTEFVSQGINITADNVAKTHGISFETTLSANYKKILKSFISFDLQHVIKKTGQEGYQARLIGDENTISPPWILRGGISSALPFISKVPVRLTSRVMVVAPRRASGENIVQNGSSYKLPAYAKWFASIALPDLELLDKGKTSFSLNAYNILDSKGPDPGFSGVDYPHQRRPIMLEKIQTF